uniref:MIF4G domain-containing protein n=1 Tax=Heterorhabditis bacteriophora TaxID=37862 RepID=A0A1I7WW37_HETBA
MPLPTDTTDDISTPSVSSWSHDVVSKDSEPSFDTIEHKLTKSERKALYKPTFLEPHESRRKVLKDVFVNEKDEALKNELISSILFFICETDENPYYSILQLHKICPDYATNKANSLAGIIIQNFKKWLYKQENRNEIYESCMTDDLKKEAFQVATAKNTIHLKLFIELFRLDDTELLPFIKNEINVRFVYPMLYLFLL